MTDIHTEDELTAQIQTKTQELNQLLAKAYEWGLRTRVFSPLAQLPDGEYTNLSITLTLTKVLVDLHA